MIGWVGATYRTLFHQDAGGQRLKRCAGRNDAIRQVKLKTGSHLCEKVFVELGNDHVGISAAMIVRWSHPTFRGDFAAGRTMMIPCCWLWFVDYTFVLPSGQDQGRLPNAGAVHPLQRNADAGHQQIEREPGSKPPCEGSVEHGAKIGLREGFPETPDLNAFLRQTVSALPGEGGSRPGSRRYGWYEVT